MRFTPYTKEEAEKKRLNLLPEGRYNARVVAASEKESNSGNPMMALELEVYTSEGSVILKDWLVATDSMAWKTQHFAEAAGLGTSYAAGILTEEDCLGKTVVVEVKTQKPKPGDKYQNPQSRIVDYMDAAFAGGNAPKPSAAPPLGSEEDDLPF